MRIVKFTTRNAHNELADLSDADVDALAFGAIEMDESGKIMRYNAAEADISGRDADDMVGRNFFTDVAPCTNNATFAGRFHEGVAEGSLDIQFSYVFDHQMSPTEVRVRLTGSRETGRYWVLVKRL